MPVKGFWCKLDIAFKLLKMFKIVIKQGSKLCSRKLAINQIDVKALSPINVCVFCYLECFVYAIGIVSVELKIF